VGEIGVNGGGSATSRGPEVDEHVVGAGASEAGAQSGDVAFDGASADLAAPDAARQLVLAEDADGVGGEPWIEGTKRGHPNPADAEALLPGPVPPDLDRDSAKLRR
jgi:hypothetical protein